MRDFFSYFRCSAVSYDLGVGVVSALLGKDPKPGFVCSRFSAVGAVVSVGCSCFVFSFVPCRRRGIFLLMFCFAPGPPLLLVWVGLWGFYSCFCAYAFRVQDTDELDELRRIMKID